MAASNCHKPLELYSVIDPLCPECWALEPILKKLQVEYGQYFTLRHIIGGRLDSLNSFRKKGYASAKRIAERWDKTGNRTGMSCDGDLWREDPILAPYLVFLAIKAAELQGKQSGNKFLRTLREHLFLQKQNISKEDVLYSIAEMVGLDACEFMKDIHSQSAIKALHCDWKFANEMEIDQIPTLIMFNDKAEDEGLKIAGSYQYSIYVTIIEEMLGFRPEPSAPPPIEEFMKTYRFVATKELAVVYNMSESEVETTMKKLVLQQLVKKVPVKHGTFWKYTLS
ncbi:ClpXP adapter SpxH family protein [Fictibacillus solisalsi]|uniref:ClpXP adapter SpxH family protein n=1 Tax=Fictibacillus solisalsi TaxID=459525 RepID=UPI00147D07EB|nr:ClpXP adapter SpxH family protein [Fictibacillus solisalsi]